MYIAPFQWEWALQQVGLTVAECEQAAWAVSPQGVKYRGAAAINVAVDALLGRGRICARMYNLPLIGAGQDAIYQYVANHRSKFPGMTPAVAAKSPWKPQRD